MLQWEDEQEFICRLNTWAGEPGYRPPTETARDYAARARTSRGSYARDLDTVAWHKWNSGGRPQPVGCKAPNSWGLRDAPGTCGSGCTTGPAATRAGP